MEDCSWTYKYYLSAEVLGKWSIMLDTPDCKMAAASQVLLSVWKKEGREKAKSEGLNLS